MERLRSGRDIDVVTDEELLPALAKGEETAFTLLYRRRQGAIYRYALQMTGSTESAAEVTQEVFLALLRQAHQLRSQEGTVQSWLYAVARNKIYRSLATETRYAPMDEDAPASANLHEDLESADLLGHLRDAIPGLPAQYREVLALCIVENLPYAEAARIADVPEGTIRSRLHRAKAMLAERLLPARKVS